MPNQNNKKSNQKILPIISLSVSILTLIIVIAASIALVYKIDLSTMEVENRLNGQNARLKFCYNESIQPCEDASILKWNEEHPDDAFILY